MAEPGALEVLEALVEHSQDQLVFLDRDFNFVRVNRAYAETCRRRPAELVGKNHFALYPHPENQAIFARVRDTGEPAVWREKPFVFPDQPERGVTYWDWTLSRIDDGAGEILGLVFSLREVTDKVLARQRIKESEERFRLALRNAPVSVAAQDRALRFVWAENQRTVDPAWVIGKTDADVFPPEIAAQLMALKRRVLDEGVEVREQIWVSAGGERRYLDMLLEPLHDEAGAVSGVGIATIDLTREREAEDALREADRRKNEFLAMLSHELRNPLAPISNSLHVLDRAPAGGEAARRAREVIGRQVSQLTRLVDDLLDVTRIARGKIRVAPRRVDAREIVRRAVEDHRSLFDARGVRLAESAPEEPAWIDADASRIAQAVGNLLQNAAKFTPQGGGATIALDRDEATGRARITVSDSGVGLSAETMVRLFVPFSQGETTIDRSAGGLGLGLSLVKGLLELHGGEVTAESDGPGRGARFTLHLPLSSEGPTEGAPAHPSAPAPPRRVLVIEDNLDAAESLREVLALDGHEVHVASTGPEGIALAEELHPEVVLCDIGLPGMDGYEVARALRASPRLRGVTIVALSGYALPENLRRATEAGFHEHLAKPPDLARLGDLLRR